MQIITLILAAMAMVAAFAALILVILERKRSRALVTAVDQRFRGMAKANKESQNRILRCAEEGNKKAIATAEELAEGINKRIDKAVRVVNAKAEAAQKAAQENKGRIDDLEQGIVPDFETAQKAVNAVNDINKGIAGILGFDPLEAMKQSRQEGD